MGEKYPIIFFKQRMHDNTSNEPGGSDNSPSWVLQGEDLIERARGLKSIIDGIAENVTIYEDYDVPSVLEVTIIEKAKAKSHQKKVAELFHSTSKDKQIAMKGENKLLFAIKNNDSLNVIREKLEEVEAYKNPISAIEHISVYTCDIIGLNTDAEIFRMEFFDYIDDEENLKLRNTVKKKLEDLSVCFSEYEYNENEFVLNIEKEVLLDKLEFIRKMPLERIEPVNNIDPYISVSDEEEDFLRGLDLVEYNGDRKYPVIGLLDTGVEINELTSDWVIQGEGCEYTELEVDREHGTFIATLLIHGNEINGVNDYSIPGCKIIDVPVQPRYKINDQILIRNIRSAIKSNPEVKIWNLSISISGEIYQDKFSWFAQQLDKIQDEYDVIICKSAGNDPGYESGNTSGFLSNGAESIRALTVGSICRNSDACNSSKANFPSQYSRHGRGPGYIIKPEVVHYGGDVFLMESGNFEYIGEKSFLGKEPVKRIEPGTSFSTPKIAKNMAELDLALEGKASNLLLKALIVHSANYEGNPSLESEERLQYLGYGKPRNSYEILDDSDPYSATIVLQGKLQKGKRIDIMDFPYPENLIKNGKYTGQIKVTLVYNNHLAEKLGSEYCQSDIELKFGTYENKKSRDITRKTILNPIGRDGSTNILISKSYSVKSQKANIHHANEMLLIQYGDKYYPVKKYAVDLKNLTPSYMKKVDESRLWFLYLVGQYRGYIEKTLTPEELAIDFALIITIKDETRTTNVHNGMLQALEKHNFTYNELNLDMDINIEL
ncbi:S8 family peptidase [Turicibacter sanguinis]|uniref:S8 family peptidase n=1 Tax=Turicibacter sanguinis TaxID=154288 RepID=UPI0021D4AD0B|nr:S8 family peptidase [Turicibacter sanguinis]MCU7200808.1 S8 family peptidase [Turicibacter sanguinis]